MKKSLVLAALAIAVQCFGSTVAQAYTIQPVNATATDTIGGTFDRQAIYTVNGNGLVGSQHVNFPPDGTMWLTGGATSADITFDLGSQITFDNVKVWNYNEGIPNLTTRSAKTVVISTSNDNSTFINPQTYIFAQANGQNNYTGEVYAMPSTTAQYVKFSIADSYGLPNTYVGLSEVRFYTNTLIVADNFNGGGNGASTNGRTPDLANLPGGTWSQATSQTTLNTTTTAGYGNPLTGAYQTFQSASAVSISSAGGYVKPTEFTIQADLSPKDVAGLAANGRGISLGFYSSLDPSGGGFSQAHFTGLVLDSAGNLNLVQDPNATGFFGGGSFLGTPVAYAGGTFDPNAFYTLRYDVSTTTGAISNIFLSGSTADYSSLFATTLFTDAATAFAGSYGSSEVGSGAFGLDNFLVYHVPEPSSVVLLGLGVVALARVRRRTG